MDVTNDNDEEVIAPTNDNSDDETPRRRRGLPFINRHHVSAARATFVDPIKAELAWKLKQYAPSTIIRDAMYGNVYGRQLLRFKYNYDYSKNPDTAGFTPEELKEHSDLKWSRGPAVDFASESVARSGRANAYGRADSTFEKILETTLRSGFERLSVELRGIRQTVLDVVKGEAKVVVEQRRTTSAVNDLAKSMQTAFSQSNDKAGFDSAVEKIERPDKPVNDNEVTPANDNESSKPEKGGGFLGGIMGMLGKLGGLVELLPMLAEALPAIGAVAAMLPEIGMALGIAAVGAGAVWGGKKIWDHFHKDDKDKDKKPELHREDATAGVKRMWDESIGAIVRGFDKNEIVQNIKTDFSNFLKGLIDSLTSWMNDLIAHLPKSLKDFFLTAQQQEDVESEEYKKQQDELAKHKNDDKMDMADPNKLGVTVDDMKKFSQGGNEKQHIQEELAKAAAEEKKSAGKMKREKLITAPTFSTLTADGKKNPIGLLLDDIAVGESPIDGYEGILNGGNYNRAKAPAHNKKFEDMSLAEIIKFQTTWRTEQRKTRPMVWNKEHTKKVPKPTSEAIGRYQFEPGTLEESANQLGLDLNNTKFTPEVQDKLAIVRLKMRADRSANADEFMHQMQAEWASAPLNRIGAAHRNYVDQEAKVLPILKGNKLGEQAKNLHKNSKDSKAGSTTIINNSGNSTVHHHTHNHKSGHGEHTHNTNPNKRDPALDATERPKFN